MYRQFCPAGMIPLYCSLCRLFSMGSIRPPDCRRQLRVGAVLEWLYLPGTSSNTTSSCTRRSIEQPTVDECLDRRGPYVVELLISLPTDRAS